MNGWLGFLVSGAFMAGLLGGVHCAAMCGGIVAACSGGAARTPAHRWRLTLAYNAGRIASYTAAGFAAGALGQGALHLRGGLLAQQAMLTLAGASMLLLALYMSGVTTVVRRLEHAGTFIWRRVQPHTRYFLPADTVAKSLALGGLWGWLPCGMVYGVLITSVATGDAVHGSLVMLAFGAGTLPNLLALSAVTHKLRAFRQKRVARIAVSAAIAVAALFAIYKSTHPAVAHAITAICATFVR